MQRKLFSLMLFVIVLYTVSCTKQTDSANTQVIPKLLKTVYKSNLTGDSVVTTYTYDVNDRLIFLDIKSKNWNTTYDFQRNGSGLLTKLIKSEFNPASMAATLEQNTTTPYYISNSAKIQYAKTVTNYLPISNYDSVTFVYNASNVLASMFAYKKSTSSTDTSSSIRSYFGYDNNGNCINFKGYQKSLNTPSIWDLWDNNFYTYETNRVNPLLTVEEAALTGLYEYCSKSSLKNYEANGLVTLKSTAGFTHTFNSLNIPTQSNVIYTGALFGFDNGKITYYY